jgi:hypothetical protein
MTKKKKKSPQVIAAIIAGIFVLVAACIGAIATITAGGLGLFKHQEPPIIVQIASPSSLDVAATTIPPEPFSPSEAPTTELFVSEPTALLPLEIPTLVLTRIPPTSLPDLNLPMGESYRGNGFRVVLESISGKLTFYLVVYNERTTPLIFSTYDTYAHLRDDAGNEYKLASWNSRLNVQQYNIQPGSNGGIGNWDQLIFEGPINPKASYLIFEFDELLGLKILTWMIPIN